MTSCLCISYFLFHPHISVVSIYRTGHNVIIQFHLTWGNFKSFSRRHLFIISNTALIKQFILVPCALNDHSFRIPIIGWYLLQTSSIPSDIIIFAITSTPPIILKLPEGINHFWLIFALPIEPSKMTLLIGKSKVAKYQCCFPTQISSTSHSHLTLTKVCL